MQANNLQPFVSIMMTSYNRAEYIGEAIESVIAQSYENWELLVLDDSSTDATVAVAEGFAEHDARVHVLPAPRNLGIAANRNRGFALAHGKYIAVLDSDDIWNDPEKLAAQVAFLEVHTDHVLVGTDVRTIGAVGVQLGMFTYEHTNDTIRTHMLRRNQFTHSSVLFRTPHLRYDETLLIGEDYDFFLRLGMEGKYANLSSYMTTYRIHTGGITKERKVIAARNHLAIIRKYHRAYPHYFLAWIKAQLRILKSYF